MSNLDTYTYMSNTHSHICQMCIYIETLYMSNLDKYTYMSNTHTHICRMCVYIETLYMSNMYTPVDFTTRKKLHQKRPLHLSVYEYVLMRLARRGGGLGSRPKKMYGERLGDGVEYHLMKPTPRRWVPFTTGRRFHEISWKWYSTPAPHLSAHIHTDIHMCTCTQIPTCKWSDI